MKIRKVEELVDSLLDKKEYVIQNRNFKKSLNHGLLLKKLHIVEPCIDMITEIRENSKTDFEKKNIFKLMNNTVFRKNYGKCEKTWRYQVYNNQSKNELLVSEPNYHTTKTFSKYFLAIEKKYYAYS